MKDNAELITLKQGDLVIQDKYTKRDLKQASRKLEIASVTGLLIALILLLLVRFNFYVAHIDSPSMVPTLSVGDLALYGPIGTLERGDIIMFDPTTEENADLPMMQSYEGSVFTKRIIGLPGEHIRMEEGIVYINDVPLDEPYAVYIDNPDPYYMTMRDMDEITIPERCYFVMGDNRDHSADSRVFGVIPRENILRSHIFSFSSIAGWLTGYSNDEFFL